MDKRIKFVKDNRPSGANKEYRNSLRIVHLAEAINDPEIKEVKSTNGEEFVLYGEKNDYFDNLILRYLGSPTNSRCINGIADMIYGRGLDATNSKDRPKDFLEMKRLFNSHEVRRTINDLKLLGEGMAQVVYNKDKSKILKFVHTPRETWRAGKAVGGVIKNYLYHPCWKDYKRGDKLKNVPTFGHGGKDDLVELYVFRPYRSGFYYYSPVDYHGCLQYCELEEEVSNYHISNIQNGLQPSMLINFNNGVPPEETQELLERKIMEKFSGSSNAGRFILAFNDDVDSSATIEPIQINDAHAQYQFLADEAREKIMLGHGVVSPILLGIKDNTGFGNNAEELRTASILNDNMVIRPFQNIMLDGLNEILAYNKCYLNTYFKTLQPIEFTDVDKIATKIRREEETGEKLSAIALNDFSDEEGEEMLKQLKGLGEVVSDDWELIHSEPVNGEEKLSNTLEMLYEANPNDPSQQDSGEYKIRYAYMPMRNSPESRNFCKTMETFTARNTVFRKEDINMMSFRGINNELGHNKRNYSLFKYKGGKNCKHFWELRVYKLRVSSDSEVSKDSVPPPNNPDEVPIKPYDMPGRGAHPSTLSEN
jgi:hypothetical protein